jgi:hypothetical protein
MPVKDGFEVAAFIKGRPALQHVPVILLTGAFDPVDDARVAAVGAAAVLAKPFEPQVLVSRVRDLLRSAKPASPDTATPAPTADAPRLVVATTTPEAASSSVDEYFDRLDKAFATLNAPLEPRQVTRFPRAVPSPETESRPPEDEARIESLPDGPANVETAATAVFASENGDGAETVGDPGPTVVAGAAAPRDSSLAKTFATLLAVEQGELPASALAPGSHRNEDALVDRIVRRVIEQMGDRAVRDLATEIVSRTAERLVREEIDRIKSGA